MNAAYVTTVAAFAGSAIGGLMSFGSAWLTQGRHDRALQIGHDKASRYELYKEFISEASRLYADALAHDVADISGLFHVYALLSQIRVLSSSEVVKQAESIVGMIVDTYTAPNKAFPELRELINNHAIDPLRAFSHECRAELQDF
jgi:hypothetical protein